MVPVKKRQQRHNALMLTFKGVKQRVFLSFFVKHLFFCPPSFLFNVSEMAFFFIATLCCCWISFFYMLLWNILWKPLNMTCAEFQRVNLCEKCENVISEWSSHPNFCNLCRIIGAVYNMFVWIVWEIKNYLIKIISLILFLNGLMGHKYVLL